VEVKSTIALTMFVPHMEKIFDGWLCNKYVMLSFIKLGQGRRKTTKPRNSTRLIGGAW
jgi:hypothetical protein